MVKNNSKHLNNNLEEEFFLPDNIFLVVGASNDSEKYGSKVFIDLLGAGYHVVPINARAANAGEEVHNTPTYPSLPYFFDRVLSFFDDTKRLEAIQKAVVVLVIPPAAANRVLEEAHLLGVSKVWFQPGAESDEALAFCKEHNMVFLANQCIMVSRPKKS